MFFRKFFKKHKKLDDNAIFTHNCGGRIVAGRLEQTASMMALGSTLGTTVDGSHKGSGITKMQGQIARVQYYFENQSWIYNTYFKQRGLNKLGYDESVQQAESEDDIVLEGEIDLDSHNSTTTFDFDGEHAEIDNRKDQKFEEI